MKFVTTKIEGLFVLHLHKQYDERGCLYRLYDRDLFAQYGYKQPWLQQSVVENSESQILRGLHYQLQPYAENKLIRCIAGNIFDVIVDLRQQSSSYGQVFTCELDGTDNIALLVPAGCAHGYVTLSNNSAIFYAMDKIYNPESATGINWQSPELAIAWPIANPRINARDQAWPMFAYKEIANI